LTPNSLLHKAGRVAGAVVDVGAFGWVCDDAATGWGGGVGDERVSAEDLAALRAALLALHEDFLVRFPAGEPSGYCGGCSGRTCRGCWPHGSW
jgi:hypothetical protein